MADQEPTCLQFIVSAVVTVVVPAVWLWLGDPGGVLRVVLLVLLVLSVGGLIVWIVLYGVMFDMVVFNGRIVRFGKIAVWIAAGVALIGLIGGLLVRFLRWVFT